MARESRIFDPIDMEDFRDAVKGRNGIAIIGTTTFLFNYTATAVYFKPKYSYAPSGWIELERIERGDDI